jgi:ADP-ribosylglycohydrolase
MASAACGAVAPLVDRLKGALYGMLIADALAMPSHWYYGGQRQVARDYGPITSYVAPLEKLPGSIMGKSNTGGAGRGGDKGSVIGDVIFHGKKKYWRSGSGFHYHRGMEAGSNTLEALLARRAINVTSTIGGRFDVDAVRDDYISFMTTPGSHNDTYCGTCHRMYFASWSQGVPPSDCPSNDGHNVDVVDALVATIPIALRSADDAEAEREVQAMVAITRDSRPAQQHAALFARALRSVVRGAATLESAVVAAARSVRYDVEGVVARDGFPSPQLDPVHA